jgi:hypothetical protein
VKRKDLVSFIKPHSIVLHCYRLEKTTRTAYSRRDFGLHESSTYILRALFQTWFTTFQVIQQYFCEDSNFFSLFRLHNDGVVGG